MFGTVAKSFRNFFSNLICISDPVSSTKSLSSWEGVVVFTGIPTFGCDIFAILVVGGGFPKVCCRVCKIGSYLLGPIIRNLT